MLVYEMGVPRSGGKDNICMYVHKELHCDMYGCTVVIFLNDVVWRRALAATTRECMGGSERSEMPNDAGAVALVRDWLVSHLLTSFLLFLGYEKLLTRRFLGLLVSMCDASQQKVVLRGFFFPLVRSSPADRLHVYFKKSSDEALEL